MRGIPMIKHTIYAIMLMGCMRGPVVWPHTVPGPVVVPTEEAPADDCGHLLDAPDKAHITKACEETRNGRSIAR